MWWRSSNNYILNSIFANFEKNTVKQLKITMKIIQKLMPPYLSKK